MRGRLVAAVLAGTMLLAACGGGDDPGAGDGGGGGEFGPLAVVGPQNAVMEALTAGTLRVTDECVYLEDAGGGETLLVWAANWTRWDADDRAVLYAPFDAEAVRLHDGDVLQLGGGGSSVDEGGVPDRQWVNPPAAACPTDQVWSVGEVVSVEPA